MQCFVPFPVVLPEEKQVMHRQKLSLITMAVMAASVGLLAPLNAQSQTDAIQTNQTYQTNTTLAFEGRSGFQIPNSSSSPILITIAGDAVLTLEHAVSQEFVQTWGTANASQSRTIDFTHEGSMTFTGGGLIFRKENFFADDSSYGTTEQFFIRGGAGAERSELTFNTDSLIFEGDVRAGFAVSGTAKTLTFNNGFSMTIDRRARMPNPCSRAPTSNKARF